MTIEQLQDGKFYFLTSAPTRGIVLNALRVRCIRAHDEVHLIANDSRIESPMQWRVDGTLLSRFVVSGWVNDDGLSLDALTEAEN